VSHIPKIVDKLFDVTIVGHQLDKVLRLEYFDVLFNCWSRIRQSGNHMVQNLIPGTYVLQSDQLLYALLTLRLRGHFWPLALYGIKQPLPRVHSG
jgi:hypothetical protein